MEGLVKELTDFAEAEFSLDKPDEMGKTPRQRGEVNNLNVPFQLSHLLEQYIELHCWRKEQLTCNDILAWASLVDIKPSHFDLEVFQRLEATYWRIKSAPAITAPENQSVFQQLQELQQREKKSMRKVDVSPVKK